MNLTQSKEYTGRVDGVENVREEVVFSVEGSGGAKASRWCEELRLKEVEMFPPVTDNQ